MTVTKKDVERVEEYMDIAGTIAKVTEELGRRADASEAVREAARGVAPGAAEFQDKLDKLHGRLGREDIRQ